MNNNAFQKPSLKRAHFQYTTLLVPEIPVDYRVVSAFTERSGGVSQASYDSLNLATHVSDNPNDVIVNRLRLLSDLKIPREVVRIITPNQVHGTDVLVADKTEDFQTCISKLELKDVPAALPHPGNLAHPESFPDQLKAQDTTSLDPRKAADHTDAEHVKDALYAGDLEVVIPSCDAVVCNRTDTAVLLCFADCVPVILCAPDAFAVIHSGWRGTIGHISLKAHELLKRCSQAEPEDIYAFIGPAIGPDSYEVSPELAETFREAWPQGQFNNNVPPSASSRFPQGLTVVREDNHLDLRAAIARDLIATGLPVSNIVVSDICTAENMDRFFSYRASGGACGRHAAVAFLRS